MEQNFEPAIHVKSCYVMKSYSALNQIDPKNTSDARAQAIFEKTPMQSGKRYDFGVLWAEDNLELPHKHFAAMVYIKSLEKRLKEDQPLGVNYSNSINDDLIMRFLLRVKDTHKVESSSEREWYPLKISGW